MRIAGYILVILGISIAGCRENRQGDIPVENSVKNLLRTELSEEFIRGREVLIDYVEIPPNTALKRHWHPGEEFHYYLEGEVEIKFDGEKSIKGTPGKIGHVPYKKWHTAIAGSKGARILVFRVHTHSEPIRYVDDEKKHIK